VDESITTGQSSWVLRLRVDWKMLYHTIIVEVCMGGVMELIQLLRVSSHGKYEI
jgi:hypothetical protein